MAVLAGWATLTLRPEASDLWLPSPLHVWAEGHHEGAPPPGFEIPEPTCPLGDWRTPSPAQACVLDAYRSGGRAVALRSFESAYPDAIDEWIVVDSSEATVVTRTVFPGPEPAVDPAQGAIADHQLRVLEIGWHRQFCDALVVQDQGWLDCESSLAVEMDDVHEARVSVSRSTRSLTDAERADLAWRYACVHGWEPAPPQC